MFFLDYSREKKFSFRAVIEFLCNTYKNEGFLGLYRGNSATMARIIPYAAIQFTAHEQWRKFLGVDVDGRYIIVFSQRHSIPSSVSPLSLCVLITLLSSSYSISL